MPSPDPQSAHALGLIRVEGADAQSFLRAQLSNDVFRLGQDRHFLAAWCDAKGRTQLVARVAVIDDAFLLILPRSLIEPVIKRLRMYVLRARVTLTDASGDYGVGGLLNAEAAPDVNETRSTGSRWLLGLPPTGPGDTRTLVLDKTSSAPVPPDCMAVDAPDWRITDIDAGVPEIGPATQGEFVPQMLNLHWLAAIDFDKGCYPGQEVIARLHYRGRLTRRVFRLACEGPAPEIGEALLDDEQRRIGTILQAATSSGRTRTLAVVATDAATRPIVTAAGAALSLLALPYATPD